jgi:putative aldouronate transport system substrate-binding protein
MHWKKKGFAILLALTLLFSLIVGCENKSSTAAKVDGATSAGESGKPKYPSKMTYWVPMSSEAEVSIKSNNEMGLYKAMEKITGTKVEFQHPPSGQETDQYNLMMATGTLPDIVEYTWASSFPDKAIKDGKILRLNELIEKYAPNLSKILKETPELRKQITSEDGNIYVFPSIARDPNLVIFHGPMVRKDWLDKLHIEPPTTIDEWEKMLVAFRDGDPNGNNKKDEIPFFYRKDDFEYSSPFIGAFGILAEFYNDGGKVKYGPYQPQFKDFLTLMHKWYKDGLIDKDYMTSDAKIRDSKMLNDQLGSMVGWVGGSLGGYMDLKRDKDPKFKLMGLPFPKLGKNGTAYSVIEPMFNGIGAAISAGAKNPEQIAAWLDYGYSQEGFLLYNFGVEGESYTMVDKKPKFTDLILHNPKGLTIAQALSTYSLLGSGGPFEYSGDGYVQYNPYPEQIDAKAVWAKADHSKLLPPVSLTSDEQGKYAAIMTDLETYKNEMIDKFITGAESLDKFDDYIKTLKKLGIEDATKLYQAAYDRYMKK